jgi:uncharacterized coiled-coil protein SlyX
MTYRFTKAELAELERLLQHDGSHRILLPVLLARAPRLIAAARLANEQDYLLVLGELRRVAEVNSTALADCQGTIAERDATIAKQAGQIAEAHETIRQLIQLNDTPSAAAAILDGAGRLAERDATIERLQSENDSMSRRWHDLERIQDRQLTFDSVAMELADSEERLRQADATIAKQAARIAELGSRTTTDWCGSCGQGWDAVTDGAARLAERDATIARQAEQIAALGALRLDSLTTEADAIRRRTGEWKP